MHLPIPRRLIGRVALPVIAVAALLSVPAQSAASLTQPFGAETYYAGARWDLVPAPAIGAYATLRLDAAFAADRRRGGHVAQMLWVNTNKPLSKDQRSNSFSGARRVPYIAAGISDNRAGALRPAIFVAQRNVRGEYFETYAPRSVNRGQEVGFAIQCATNRGCDSKNNKGGNNGWTVRVSGLNAFLPIRNAGPRAGSSAMFAGLTSTGRGNAVAGRVSDLAWIIGGVVNFPHPNGWFMDKRRFTPIIAGNGPVRARWEKQFVSLYASMNR